MPYRSNFRFKFKIKRQKFKMKVRPDWPSETSWHICPLKG